MKNVQDTIRGVRDAATVARLLVYHFPLFANPPEKLDTASLRGASVLIYDALDALDAAFVEDRRLSQPHYDALRNGVKAIRDVFDADEGLVSDFANGKVSADDFAGAFHKAMTAVVKKADALSRDYFNAIAEYNSRRLGV